MSRAIRIAFVGSRGIPVSYGGFESHIEEVSRRFTDMGLQVYVTCESRRFQQDVYDKVVRVHSPAIQGKTLTIPTLNDFLASFHLLVRCPGIDLVQYPFDAVPAVAILRLFGKKIIASTGGIEWKRPIIRRRYLSPAWKIVSVLGSWYLKWLEWAAVKLSNVVIADSRAIKIYLEERYKAKNVTYISYGARELCDSGIGTEREQEILDRFGLSPEGYYLTVARIVAENNIHVEIRGFGGTKSSRKLVVVGNFNERDRYTNHLIELKKDNHRIVFLDPIYDKEELGIVRKNCFAYIHAYEVGGTNPTLLEQMLFAKPILAADVPFHREVLQAGGIYFGSPDELAECITKLEGGEYDVEMMGRCQIKRIDEEYNWELVSHQYAELFRKLAG